MLACGAEQPQRLIVRQVDDEGRVTDRQFLERGQQQQLALAPRQPIRWIELGLFVVASRDAMIERAPGAVLAFGGGENVAQALGHQQIAARLASGKGACISPGVGESPHQVVAPGVRHRQNASIRDETVGCLVRHRDSDSSLSAESKGPSLAHAERAPDLVDLKRELTSYLPDLRAFARFLARDPAEADDLVQDTVLRALGALDQFRPGTNLKAWLFTIQRNAFYETARRRKRETRLLAERGVDVDSEAPRQVSRSDVSDLQRLLFVLPPLLREALVLVGAQELSHEAAASICGVPVGTMKARVSRARTMLAKLAQSGS